MAFQDPKWRMIAGELSRLAQLGPFADGWIPPPLRMEAAQHSEGVVSVEARQAVPIVVTDACGFGDRAAEARSLDVLRFAGDAMLTDAAGFSAALAPHG